MLEAKLQGTAAQQMELRASAKPPKAEKKGPEKPKEEEDIMDIIERESKEAKEKAKEKESILVPMLQGLTVEEIVQAHQDKSQGSSLQAQMQATLEEDEKAIPSLASLSQRLQQISYGYQCMRGSQDAALPPAEPQGDHMGRMQLESPLHNIDMWGLLPVRKPLLTKRSRRCRLAPKGDSLHDAQRQSSMASGLKTSGGGQSGGGASGRQCGKIVVKPQINPCSNPPFQKNNTAVAFITQCHAWEWQRDDGRDVSNTFLGPDERAQLVFSMQNPLDSDVKASFDPTLFNPGRSQDESFPNKFEAFLEEQNVEVITHAFHTTLTKCNDFADVHEAFGEEAERSKKLQEEDNPEVVVGRKMHKLLIKFRIQGKQGSQPKPWVFYVKLNLQFKDASSGAHDVDVIMRFSPEKHGMEYAPLSRRSARKMTS